MKTRTRTIAYTYTLSAITNHTPGTEKFWTENDTHYGFKNNEIHEWGNNNGQTVVIATIVIEAETTVQANQLIEDDYPQLANHTPHIEEI